MGRKSTEEGTSQVALEPTGHCRRPQRCRFDPWVGRIPWRRKWQPTPVFLPGEAHGQRSLQTEAGCSPWCCSDLTHTYKPMAGSLFCTAEANTALQSHYVMCTKLFQSCPALCNPMDCSPPGPSVHGILQARILEWVAISSFRGSSQPVSLESPAFASEFKRHLGSPVHLYAYLKKKKPKPKNQLYSYTKTKNKEVWVLLACGQTENRGDGRENRGLGPGTLHHWGQAEQEKRWSRKNARALGVKDSLEGRDFRRRKVISHLECCWEVV